MMSSTVLPVWMVKAQTTIEIIAVQIRNFFDNPPNAEVSAAAAAGGEASGLAGDVATTLPYLAYGANATDCSEFSTVCLHRRVPSTWSHTGN